MAVADRIELATARVVPMRELNQHTSTVLDEINQSGLPAVVTKHGRFVALLTPLANRGVESLVLSSDPKIQALMQAEVHREADEPGGDDAGLTVDEARAQLRNHS